METRPVHTTIKPVLSDHSRETVEKWALKDGDRLKQVVALAGLTVM
jgi:hypothetical protein